MNNDGIKETNISPESNISSVATETSSNDTEFNLNDKKSFYHESKQELSLGSDETQEVKTIDGFAVVFKEPKRLAIFILSIVIALALIIAGSVLISTRSGEGTTTNNGSVETYDMIMVNSPISIYVNGSTYQYFKFVPQTSAQYSFYTVSSGDTYGCLCDSSFSVILSDDDSGNGTNFKITKYLSSGETYYIGVKAYEGSFSATLYAIRG